MFPSDEDPNSNNSNPDLDKIDANLSSESVALRKKQLESAFKKLIIFGLTLGTILGLTAYYLMHRFGLTKKPYQLEQERIERERKVQLDVEEINNFPASDRLQERFKL